MTAVAAKACRDAASVVATRGHCKQAFESFGAESGVCLWGAVGLAVSGDASYAIAYPSISDPVMLELRAFFAERLNSPDLEGNFPGATWNDQPDTTGEDVQKFLLQTADEIEFMEGPAL